MALNDNIPVINWEVHLSDRMKRVKSSAIREILKITSRPDIISFAGGLPASEFFPIEAIKKACDKVLTEQGPAALQYSTTEGHPPLRTFLAESMHKYGVPAVANNVLVTCGSQQALDLVGKVFLNVDDVVIVSRPTYLGALQAWNAYGTMYETVSLDEHGMVVDEIEDIYHRVLKTTGKPPRFVYVLPNFHNPAGTTLSLERRQKLAEIARKLELIIVEDDPYGQLRYEGESLPPICCFAPERVLYLGTFSKTLTPGLRLGWIVAPEAVIARFVQLKQGTDLHTGSLVQLIAYEIAQSPLFKEHISMLRREYGIRRNTMLEALTRYWPEGCSWTKPMGGLFLWALVPDKINTNDFLMKAVEQKVAFVAGSHFYPDGGGYNTMRLNFSYCRPEIIDEGINRLGMALKKELGA
ncbi:PLP-dependent aminotransferase family protein [bacterium]|nr:PLP-dependent aminotransferase family protein [bacterium]